MIPKTNNYLKIVDNKIWDLYNLLLLSENTYTEIFIYKQR